MSWNGLHCSPVDDLTTNGIGVHPDAEAIAIRRPRIDKTVPGQQWTGIVGGARAVLRLPEEDRWNGKLMIGVTPAVRSEYSLDWLVSDIVLQQGYAYAACDKGTPGLILRDPNRSMEEWMENYLLLTQTAQELVQQEYRTAAQRTYLAGASNGGYVLRRMLEWHPELYDGGVEWEGLLWHRETRHVLRDLAVYIEQFPVYANFQGHRTLTERTAAREQLLDAGLHPASEPYWQQYFSLYWVLSLWLYGRNLDPGWSPFAADWSNDWLLDPSPLVYPWYERQEAVAVRIRPIENTGRIGKPLLSVAGNYDCLVSFSHNAAAYQGLVAASGAAELHRLYEIEGGNHTDGLLRQNRGQQQPVHPYFEATLQFLDRWVEHGVEPPRSGLYTTTDSFCPNLSLYTL